ncbi:transaldolase [Denitromonas iodatirespirans]|uniref:Transaldolase n=1 Tax=Denitromonas iodatirespirans TaxID=2795389 RepID=A0A944DFU2_DENI1|nr:transaldolase [Denitromonas iodatirespirans]MBT0963568.1 transaldolase [Denitromonas iodatirespirans]
MDHLLETRFLGQQIWLDNLSRSLIRDGHLAEFIQEHGITGVTTNPAIFQKAIAAGRYYEDDLARLKAEPLDAEARYEQLVIPDVQAACDLLRATWADAKGEAGYVSLEVSPALAHDEDGTVAAAHRLHAAVARDNVLIKVPATAAGVRAIERLIADGISVNVTLMFSLAHVEAVAAAYVRGLETRAAAGQSVSGIFSVASLFLSRVDTLVDGQLDAMTDAARELRGGTAVAMARLAYQAYRNRFHGEAFAALRAQGARPQYMLWASTGTKNPAYSDLLYVEPLIGPETVNTLPDATLTALLDHGRIQHTLETNVVGAQAQFAGVAHLGLDMTAIGEELQRAGLAQFESAFAELLAVTA